MLYYIYFICSFEANCKWKYQYGSLLLFGLKTIGTVYVVYDVLLFHKILVVRIFYVENNNNSYEYRRFFNTLFIHNITKKVKNQFQNLIISYKKIPITIYML